MSNIFLCYSSKDRNIAAKLCARLQAEGWSVFMDRHIYAGHRWSEEIEKQLADAQAVLTLWSSHSVSSRFVMDEANRAADRGIIFPARIEAVNIPYGFGQFQTPDLIGWDGADESEPEGWRLILAALHERLDGTESEQRRRRSRSTVGTQKMVPTASGRPAPQQAPRASGRRKRTPIGAGGAVQDGAAKSKPRPASGEMPAGEQAPPSTSDSREGEGSQTKLHTAAGVDDEIAKLLAEIDNLDTTPPRRLEIGDRLDELGDPRHGIGVIERDVSAEEEKSSEGIERLLAEIDNPDTAPPRRLEIGNRLDELGDPRHGVGVIEMDVPVEDETLPKQTPPTQKTNKSEAASDIERLQAEIEDPETEPPRRLEIGDELDRLGDPRRGIGLNRDGLPDIAWIRIPAGPFIYQTGETRELPDFWIARYPITNAQFQSFVNSGAYRRRPGLLNRMREMLHFNNSRGANPGWWRGLAEPVPEASRWPQGNRPRTNVDWYEAVAFTRWLTDRLGLAEGTIRLPTEFEWEKAARGPDGLIYPWGNEYRSGFANVDEKGAKGGPWYLQQTTAVGLYPHGRSRYEVEDMAGTVWEWCLNKYEHPETITADTGGDGRSLHGGSWGNYPVSARAVDRYWNHPDYRLEFYGFRVVSSVPMPDS